MSTPKALIKSWIELVSSLPVIYDGDPEPSAPNPKMKSSVPTYAAILFIDDETGYGTTYESTSDTAAASNTVEQHRSQTRRGQLDVALYGPGAADYCRALDISLGRGDVLALLTAAGDYTIDAAQPVTDEPIVRSATRIPSASIQFTVQWRESETYNTPAVVTVTTTATVTEES